MADAAGSHSLQLADVVTAPSAAGIVWQGIVHCSNTDCRQEYPIIDGVPILVPNVRDYVAAYASQILQRRDLPGPIESLIGDCMGADDQYNLSRFYLSSYADDAYPGTQDRWRADTAGGRGIVALVDAAVGLMDGLTNVRLLDLGCGVGRSAFQLAGAGPELVLGADLSFSMIQLAQAALQDDAVVYPRRRLGLVYERCRGETVFPHKDKVDFWVCDALSLPFGAASAGAVVGLNLLDSVQSPLGLIDEAGRVLTLGGEACFATPFDWSGAVTPLTQWIGGHSQRSDYEGSSTRILRTLFPRAVAGQPARLEIAKERDGVVWESRRSDRSVTVYNNYLMSLIKTPADPEPRSGGRT